VSTQWQQQTEIEKQKPIDAMIMWNKKCLGAKKL